MIRFTTLLNSDYQKKEAKVDEYINRLLQEAGLPDDLDPEVRAGLVNSLTGRAADLINRRLIDAMSFETAQEFEKLIDDHPDDGAMMQGFIDQHVPDKNKIVAAALLELRTQYLGDKA